MRRAAVVVVVVGLLAGACGKPAIPRSAALELQDQVARIRSAVENGRVSVARHRLGVLQEQVAELLDGGVIDEGTSIEILDAAAAVGSSLGLAPTPSETPETTSPPPEEESEENHGNEGKGKGNGQGHDD